MDSIANHFQANSALDCRILHIQSLKNSGGDTPGSSQKRPRCLDPDTNFRLDRQRSHCSCFPKRPPVLSPSETEVDSSPPLQTSCAHLVAGVHVKENRLFRGNLVLDRNLVGLSLCPQPGPGQPGRENFCLFFLSANPNLANTT